ncbi:uncharacterized protein ACB057_013028 [Neosynchiropus ocellatus]
MVMTGHHAPSSAHLVLLVLLLVIPQLAGAAPAWGAGGAGGVEGRTRTDAEEDGLPPERWSKKENASLEPGRAPDDPADRVLTVLLEALDHQSDNRHWDGSREVTSDVGLKGGEIKERGAEEDREGQAADKTIERLIVSQLTAAQAQDSQRSGEFTRPDADGGWSAEGREEGEPTPDASLQRRTRGYFQNIDLGLQDNEILPPLKGYKAYNTQLAWAGKKKHWQENRPSERRAKGGNYMDDFEDGGEEMEEELEEEEESLAHMEEEARAQAEKQEVLRQQEEAERAREEEQRLADIASDMVLQYMGRKSFMKPRQKSSGAASNTAEDKRSEEVNQDDDDDMDQQMIDRLIEISSKLHLPADDVVEIISDVEEKKKKRKELLQQPGGSSPVAPRFRPLVPPPLASAPGHHYTASKNPKKAPHKYKNKKWPKSYKKDYWYRPQKQLEYWYKPPKQFLAFPSYPYYQKPYRAYYPVYFPHPKHRYFGKSPPSREQPYGPEFDLQVPRRRQRPGKGRGPGWRQPPSLPLTPYISNYILPHPRTYQPLPPPKPIAPPRRGRQPPYYYPQVTAGEDYEEDGLVPQLDSEEELENFIERIYMKRRMF